MTVANNDYSKFIENIKQKLGVDLTLYKENQMKRRLTTFYTKLGYRSFKEFFSAIEKDNELRDEFLDRMTINVTEFFRNKYRWQQLIDKVIPSLLEKSPNHLKCWSAACSTGEEPYTLSIINKERFPRINFDILATDIDENVLNKAKKGSYDAKALKELSKEQKEKYFIEHDRVYNVIPELKKNIKFVKNDLLLDNFKTGYDLIICRNVIIYFTEDAKEKLYQKFSDSLKVGGILFLGSTEQIFNPKKYNLAMVDNFFYQKIL